MFCREVRSTYSRIRFPEQIANEACQKRHWEGPQSERQCCVRRDAYFFVNREQQIRQNVYCHRGDPGQCDRERKTAFERQLHECPVEQECASLPEPWFQQSGHCPLFPHSTRTHTLP